MIKKYLAGFIVFALAITFIPYLVSYIYISQRPKDECVPSSITEYSPRELIKYLDYSKFIMATPKTLSLSDGITQFFVEVENIGNEKISFSYPENLIMFIVENDQYMIVNDLPNVYLPKNREIVLEPYWHETRSRTILYVDPDLNQFSGDFELVIMFYGEEVWWGSGCESPISVAGVITIIE